MRPLIAALDNPDEKVRRNAIDELCEIGRRGCFGAARAVRALTVVVLSDKSRYLRFIAASHLGWIGDPAAVPTLAKAAVDDEDYDVRTDAIIALGKIGPAAVAAVPAVTRALTDRYPSVRYYAALSLLRIGRAAAEAVPALERMLADSSEDEYGRGAAKKALMRIVPPRSELMTRLRSLISISKRVRCFVLFGVTVCIAFLVAALIVAWRMPGQEEWIVGLGLIGLVVFLSCSSVLFSVRPEGGLTVDIQVIEALRRAETAAVGYLPELEELMRRCPYRRVRQAAAKAVVQIRPVGPFRM